VNPDPDAVSVELPVQQAPAAPIAQPMAETTASSTDDRPLTFVEFPLGVHAPLSERLGTAAVILGHYLKMMVIPWPQSFYYGYDEVPLADMRHPWAIISALLHLLLLLCAVYFVRSHPILSFGIFTYLVCILLFSNLVSPVAGMMGDRLTYVASFGFCTAAGYVLAKLMEHARTPSFRLAVRAGIGVLLVSFSGVTIARSMQWKDALTLMRHDIVQVPRSSQAHNLLASHLMKNSFLPEYKAEQVNMRREALTHYREAVRIWPEFFNVWYDMGRVFQMMNEPVNALQCYMEAHRLDSSFYNATINAGLIADQLGDHATAIEYYERCIRFNPEMSEPYGNLSYLYFRLGRFEESIAVNKRAIAHNPNWPDPYTNIAKTYEAMGRPEDALDYRQRGANRVR
jgi:tetratricopeptide (TPR) repeat protein